MKDILGFVNCWRRTDAFILIDVEEIRGGRSIVHGISDHLQDHSLQQFVNNLTNCPVQFGYEACEFEGKQVGIIRIALQRRPVYLKHDYGKLKKGLVYARRGSSTDPTKPAEPDEIALMGSENVADVREASLTVEFAAPDREQTLGDQIDWSAEHCQMPEPKEIPILDDTLAPISLPGGQTIQIPSVSPLGLHDRLNQWFYHELANYIFFRKLVRKIRLVVANTGEVPATDVRLEICVPNGQGFGIVDESDVPDAPKRRESILAVSAMKNLKLRPAFRQAGDVDIDKNDHQAKVEVECRNLQPGRKVWTDTFYVGIAQSGEIKLAGSLFAANLPQPQEFTLSVKADITETTMTVDELMSLGEPGDVDE